MASGPSNPNHQYGSGDDLIDPDDGMWFVAFREYTADTDSNSQ
jgi:hypothetical protein